MTRDEALRILGLSSTATLNEIKKSYRNLVKITHPDRDNSPGAQQRFILVQTAYEILTDPNQRNRHEQEHARAERARQERERAAREREEWKRQEREDRERVEREARARAERERQEREKAENEPESKKDDGSIGDYIGGGCGCLVFLGIISAIFGAIQESCEENSPKGRGIKHVESRQYAEAIEDFDEAIRRDTTDADTYYRRGRAKVNLEQYADAITDYDEAIRLDPM